MFAKGPKIKRINGIELEDIMKRIWFKDQHANIKGTARFDDMTFFDELQVEVRESKKHVQNKIIIDKCFFFQKGLFNEVNLTELEENYFSKTKEQKLTGIHMISELVTFKDNVTTPEILIDGLVNGINMEKFTKSILLNRPQLFEDMVYFENVSAAGKPKQ